ncbi:hypothetical protein IC582_026048 [Cucumis melo]
MGKAYNLGRSSPLIRHLWLLGDSRTEKGHDWRSRNLSVGGDMYGGL